MQNDTLLKETRVCPSCDSTDSSVAPWGSDGWRTVACANCALVYLPEVPAYSQLAGEYEWSQSFHKERAQRLERSPVLARASRATRKRTKLFGKKHPMQYVRRHISSGNLVDVGCGTGSYLMANADGFCLHGVDISPVLTRDADAAFSTTGGYAVCAPAHEALQQFPDAYFDAATLRSYLEHEFSPRQVLEELFRVMNPGAIAVVKVPNFGSLNRRVMGHRWCGFRFPDHVNYFTPHSLAQLAAKAGFRTTLRWLDRLPTSDNMWATLTR